MKVVGAYFVAAFNQGALNDVLEFAHIVWKIVSYQTFQVLGMQRRRFLSHVAGDKFFAGTALAGDQKK